MLLNKYRTKVEELTELKQREAEYYEKLRRGEIKREEWIQVKFRIILELKEVGCRQEWNYSILIYIFKKYINYNINKIEL